MPRCFVIQPFDKGGPFDKRYRDVLVPAIEAADLEPYRVDEDPSATVLIDDIEGGIRSSEIAVADITTDNPNIWYEVGFAFANDKPVVMICADPRPTLPPFDVRHRHIISYSLDSPRDFKKLETELSARLKGQLRRTEAMQNIASLSPVKSTEGLTSYEIAALVIIMENRVTPDSGVFPREVQDQLRKAGYTKVAASLSVESLRRKGMIDFETVTNNFGEDYTVCMLTPTGVEWLLHNQDKLKLTVYDDQEGPEITDKDIPF